MVGVAVAVAVAVVRMEPVRWNRIDLYELSDGRCTVSSAEYLPGPGFTQTTEMLHVWLGSNVPWQCSLLMLNEGSPTSSTAPTTMGRGELFFTITVVVRTRRTPGGTTRNWRAPIVQTNFVVFRGLCLRH